MNVIARRNGEANRRFDGVNLVISFHPRLPRFARNDKNNKRRVPKGVAFVTLKRNITASEILILVRNCKSFSAFGSSAGQNLTAVSR